jgi:hypothetical protein
VRFVCSGAMPLLFVDVFIHVSIYLRFIYLGLWFAGCESINNPCEAIKSRPCLSLFNDSLIEPRGLSMRA